MFVRPKHLHTLYNLSLNLLSPISLVGVHHW